MLTKKQKDKLAQILARVGDMCFKRRVICIMNSLDLEDGDEVLDCGCGEGFYVMVISELFPKVKITAFDHDVDILNKAKHWLGKRKNITWVQAEWDPHKPNDLPFKNRQFDKMILSEVLEHLTDDRGALLEAKRILKPNGLLAITVPSANYPLFCDPLNFSRESLGLGHFSGGNQFLGGVWSWNHLRLYTPETLKKLVKDANFELMELHPLVRFVLPFNYWILWLGKQIYTRLPVPKTLAKSLEKFEWQDNKSTAADVTKILKKPLEVVDHFNDRYPGNLQNRHLSLFALVKKIG